MNDITVGADTKVTLHFSLKLEDGSVVDSTYDKAPASFTTGDGSLLDGFEKRIHGMKSGQQGCFVLSPEDAFGQPNPNNLQRFSRQDFASDMTLVEGMVISFADASQSELPGVVKTIAEDEVTIDFNHPLAGRKIQFDVSIINVETV